MVAVKPRRVNKIPGQQGQKTKMRANCRPITEVLLRWARREGFNALILISTAAIGIGSEAVGGWRRIVVRGITALQQRRIAMRRGEIIEQRAAAGEQHEKQQHSGDSGYGEVAVAMAYRYGCALRAFTNACHFDPPVTKLRVSETVPIIMGSRGSGEGRRSGRCYTFRRSRGPRPYTESRAMPYYSLSAPARRDQYSQARDVLLCESWWPAFATSPGVSSVNSPRRTAAACTRPL